MQLAQDRQHSGAKSAGIDRTPKPPAADQLQALAFIQALQHPRPALRMVRRATVARTMVGGVVRHACSGLGARPFWGTAMYSAKAPWPKPHTSSPGLKCRDGAAGPLHRSGEVPPGTGKFGLRMPPALRGDQERLAADEVPVLRIGRASTYRHQHVLRASDRHLHLGQVQDILRRPVPVLAERRQPRRSSRSAPGAGHAVMLRPPCRSAGQRAVIRTCVRNWPHGSPGSRLCRPHIYTSPCLRWTSSSAATG